MKLVKLLTNCSECERIQFIQVNRNIHWLATGHIETLPRLRPGGTGDKLFSLGDMCDFSSRRALRARHPRLQRKELLGTR